MTDHSAWTQYWWLIFPLAWFVFGAFAMWTRHLRHKEMMKLIQSYVAQGKEPPAAVMALLTRSAGDRGPCNPARYVRIAITLLSVAAGFGVLTYLNAMNGPARPDGPRPFLTVAVILAAVGIGFLIQALIRSPERDRLDPPDHR